MSNAQWEPSCTVEVMQLRAQMLATIRAFFLHRQVLEVETPLLCHATGTDPQLDFFSSSFHSTPTEQEMYLQTSPEFAMKRLLAAGSGSIFQICKAFRNGELGCLHNPEFSILEWYRIGFSLQQLMDEVAELIVEVLQDDCHFKIIKTISYSQLFEQHTGLNPLQFCQQKYKVYAEKHDFADAIHLCGNDHSMWLDFIFSHKIQPALEQQSFYLVYGYPAIQSSLARINQQNSEIADRFEVFVNGVEIGNGFFELADVNEQEARFNQENKIRALKGQVQVQKDPFFLDALRTGLPDCSGVAIGLDRLLMIKAQVQSLDDVLVFPFESA